MDLQLADQLVADARARAEGEGIAVAIAVVDAGGHLVAFARMPGAPFLTVDISLGKAYTAAALGFSSGQVATVLVDYPDFTPTLRAASHGKLTLGPGGSPVVLDGKLVGGLAISGGSPEQDGRIADEVVANLTN